MSNAPTNPVHRRWRWKAAMAIALVGLLALSWSRLLLTAHFASAVGEEYPGEFTGPNAIHADHFERLCRWPPAQVATYLKAPWTKWRALACQALSDGQWPADAPWTGVGVELSRVFLNDAQPAVSLLAGRAITRVLPLAPEDIPQIVQLAAESESGGRYGLLLAIAKLPNVGPSMRNLMLTYQLSDDLEDRVTSWITLANMAPEELSIEHLRSIITPGSQRQWPPLITALHQASRTRPDLIEASLEGKPTEQLVAIQAMELILRQASSAKGASPPPLSATEQRLRDKAITACEPLLFTTEGPALSSVIAVARHSPKGGHWLTRAAAKVSTAKPRLELVRGLFRFLYDGRDPFQFSAEEAEMLIGLIGDDDGAVKAETIRTIVARQSNGMSAVECFPEGAGPRNPANREIFLQLLKSSDTSVRSLTLNYFHAFPPIREEEIPSIVAAMRLHRNTAQFSRLFVDILKQFPDNKTARELRLEAEMSGSPQDEWMLRDLAKALASESTDSKTSAAPGSLP